MSRKTSTPARAREPYEQVPDRIELRCQPGRITLEALAVEGEAEVIPRFTMVAYTGEPLRVEGWRFPVVVDLEGLSIPSQRRPVRFGHSMYAGVGHTERIAVEAGRLIAEGIVSRDTVAAREVVASGKRGFPWQASIGAQVAQAEFVRAGKSVTVNSRTFEGPLYVARRTVLGEISFVDLGADGNTTATIAAQQQENELMDESKDTEVLDNVAPEAPQDEVARDEATGAGTEAGPAASATPAPVVNPVADIRAQALAETKRIAAIRSILGGRLPEIEARAIAEGWTPDRTELEKLRVTRPKAPAVHVTETAVTGQVLEAACMQAARVEKLERYFEAPVLDEADRQFDGRIGLAELIVEAARANGYVGRERRVTPEMLRYAFGREIRAAASTIDIGGILSNVANKFLLEGFFSVERTWRNICAVRNVSDFKTVTSYRLIGKDQYEQVAPGGELKHGTLGEQAYTNKADTYGLLLAIDRRDIINDDLGAITTVPRKLGRGSGLKINDIFWSIFMNNAAFFAAGNNNYLTGADTALSIEGLSKAEVAFLNQTDPDGKPLGAMPAVVLVPTALSAMATVLYKSLEIRDTTASTKYPIANPHTGKFRAEVSRYLSNTQYTGYSEKAWYLLADPIDLPVIEVAFLNGQEAPTIETADADFNVLGVQMRGYHDFGVALQEPRGGIKSKGEA
jgi:phage major head subunit gpT-like protein